jgi:hypothetical protein
VRSANYQAVHDRHHQVKQDDVRLVRDRFGHGNTAVVDSFRLVPVTGKDHFEQAGCVLIIIDDHESGHINP